MQVKTILNRLQKHALSSTVKEQIAGLALTVEIRRIAAIGRGARARARCLAHAPEFVPLWGLRVFFLYPMRRVDCHRRAGALGRRQAPADHHLHVVSRAVGQMPQLAGGRAQVFRSVAMAVAWGRDHVDLTGAIGHRRDPLAAHRLLTLADRPDAQALVWIGRTDVPRLRFFRWFGRERTVFICSDMWKAISKSPPGRIMPSTSTGFTSKHMSDDLRSAAPKSARSGSADDSRSSRRRAGSSTQGESDTRAARPLARAPPTQPAGDHALRAWFDHFWRSVGRLGRGLPGHLVRPSHALAHRGRPRRHRPLILNWFRARGEISAACGRFNNKVETDHQKGDRLAARIDAWKSLCTLHSAYRSQNLPADSAGLTISYNLNRESLESTGTNGHERDKLARKTTVRHEREQHRQASGACALRGVGVQIPPFRTTFQALKTGLN